MSRLLMTADAVGGVWTYSLDLVAQFAADGLEVHLVTMGPRPTPDQRAAAWAAPVASLQEGDFALEWMPGAGPEVERAASWLLEIAGQVRPDVVHLNGYAHAALPWPAPVVVVGHSCVLSWWAAVRATPAPAQWEDYRRRVSAGLAAADAVVAPSRAMLAELRRWYGLEGGEVIPNGRAQSRAAPLTPPEPLILAAGRVWDEAKNLHRLAALAPQLPWPVVIAGAGAGGDSAASGIGFETSTLLGFVAPEELAGLMRRASIFAAPASYEPFGFGPLEAAQAGCALLLGDIPSLREVWDDAARYVAPRDDEALVAALRELAADPPEVHRLAQRARHRAQRYTPRVSADAYLDLYARLRTHARAAPR